MITFATAKITSDEEIVNVTLQKIINITIWKL